MFVNAVDNFIKPRLIGFGVEMPMSLTILGVGGFIAFGFLGLFIGPTLIIILFTLMQAWRFARLTRSTNSANCRCGTGSPKLKN